MAYDVRGYYSRSVRDGDRVRRIYIGKGPDAQLAADLDEQRRSERLGRSLAWHAEQAGRVTAEARLRELEDQSDLMMRAALMAAGYYQHDRGAWRRRRMQVNGAMDETRSAPVTVQGDRAAPPPDQGANHGERSTPVDGSGREDRPLSAQELRDLLKRAEQGDQAVLPALQRLLDASPDLWNHCGDVAASAESAWIELIAGQDLLQRESLVRKVTALKAELAGPCAPLLERLLAERVAAGWMQAAQADAVVTQIKGKGLTPTQIDFLQRRQERTQRSYLAAIKALATVRKLAAPVPEAAGAEALRENEADVSPRQSEERPCRQAATVGAQEPRGARSAAKQSARKKRDQGESGDSIPEPLRDRMRGLVGSEN